jgi:hypothetical protein
VSPARLCGRDPDLQHLPVDGRLSLEMLERLANEFDALEPDAHYSARAFIKWIRQEAERRQATQEQQRRTAWRRPVE